MLGVHGNIRLKLRTLLQVDRRCLHISMNDSGGLKHDPFFSKEIALDFPLDSDASSIDICFGGPCPANGNVGVLQMIRGSGTWNLGCAQSAL